MASYVTGQILSVDGGFKMAGVLGYQSAVADRSPSGEFLTLGLN
jgi:hypothetical protein